MITRASKTALLLFLIVPEETEPETPQPQEFQITVLQPGEEKAPLHAVSFTAYEDEECTKPIIKDDTKLTLVSDEKGRISFDADIGECYVLPDAFPGYYQFGKPVKVDENKPLEITLEPIKIDIEDQDDALNLQFIENDGEESEKIHTDISSLMPGSSYTVHFFDTENSRLYKDYVIQIPATETDTPLKIRPEILTSGTLAIKGTDVQAVYGIFSDEQCTKEVKKIHLNEESSEDILLPAGTYYLKQVTAGSAWYPEQMVQTIHIGTDETQQIVMNSRMSGFMIHTYDAESNEDIPVLFEIQDQGEYVSNGSYHLERGKSIHLKPVRTKEGYQLPDEQTVTIHEQAGDEVVVQLPVKKKPVSSIEPEPVHTPEVEKPVKTEAPAETKPETAAVINEPAKDKKVPLLSTVLPEGTVWSLYQKGNDNAQAADTHGNILSRCTGLNSVSIAPGSYYAMIDQTPPGYYSFDQKVPLTINDDGGVLTIPLHKAALQVNCRNDGGKKFEIGLYDSRNNLLETWEGNGTRIIEEGIIPGETYTVKVMKESDLASGSVRERQITIPQREPAEIPTVTLNLRQTVRMRIEAGGEDRKAANMRYAVYEDKEMTIPAKDENDNVITLETDRSGRASADLSAGTYYLYPLETPAHWYQEEEPIKVVAKDDEPLKIEPKEVSILFHLKDSEGRYISGSSFALMDLDGKTLYEWTTGRNMTSITDMAIERGRTYILHEKRSADGYEKLADQKIEIPEWSSEPLTVSLQKREKRAIEKMIDGNNEKKQIRQYGLMTAAAISLGIAGSGLIFLKKRKKNVKARNADENEM